MALPLFHEDTTLTNDEERRLIENEAVIERGFKTFAEVGAALLDIRDSRLYRASHRAFEDYCRERWGIQRAHAYRLIDAAEVMGNLSPIGDNFPANESQARPLAQLPPEQQPAAWQRAQEIAQSEGRPLTAAHVDTAVREFKSPSEPLPFVPEPAKNGTYDTGDADDTWYDEPLTPYEERIAATYVPPVAPAPATADHQRINLSTNNEWYTPAQFVEAARQVMGRIDLDPASCEYANRTVRAEQIYTIDDDGMSQPWTGRVWMNPPYGREEGESDSNQARWTRRLIDEYQAGNVTEAVILVNAVPGNRWFAPLKNFPICFPDARIRFYNEQTEAGQPTHSNALVYLGPDVARFVAVFSQFGRVMAPLAVDGDGYRVDL